MIVPVNNGIIVRDACNNNLGKDVQAIRQITKWMSKVEVRIKKINHSTRSFLFKKSNPQSGEVECNNRPNTCKRALCECDRFFAMSIGESEFLTNLDSFFITVQNYHLFFSSLFFSTLMTYK